MSCSFKLLLRNKLLNAWHTFHWTCYQCSVSQSLIQLVLSNTLNSKYQSYRNICLTFTFPVVTQERNVWTICPSQSKLPKDAERSEFDLSFIWPLDPFAPPHSILKCIWSTWSSLTAVWLVNWIDFDRFPRALTAFALTCTNYKGNL